MHLTAVPQQQPAPASHRETAFRRAVEHALSTSSGMEAVTQIMQLYCGDTRALSARIEGLVREASDKAVESRQRFDMLTQVQMAASQKLWETAKMAAENATLRSIFDSVRKLADRSDGTPVDPTTLHAALAMEPLESVHPSVTLAFVPSGQFRGGQFISHPEADVTFVFTFIGWALVDHGPGALGCVEPMFLVEDRALPRSVIEHERHARLEKFLPHMEAVA